MAAIFQFFHIGWHWYSSSSNTQKTRDPNFGGLAIWKFSVQLIFMKWQPFFNFFIFADTDILVPATLRKPETQTLGVCNLNFSIRSIFFNFFILANTDILFPSTLINWRPKLWGLAIWNFSIWSIFMKWWPFFNCFMGAGAGIPFPLMFVRGHLCVVTFLHSENQRYEFSIGSVFRIFRWFSFPNFLLVQFSPSPFLVSISMFKTFMHGHLCVVTFLNLENQRCEFSIGSVFQTYHWFSFPHHPS